MASDCDNVWPGYYEWWLCDIRGAGASLSRARDISVTPSHSCIKHVTCVTSYASTSDLKFISANVIQMADEGIFLDHLWIVLTSLPDSNNKTDSFVNKDINYLPQIEVK